jgi:hypothetical protein
MTSSKLIQLDTDLYIPDNFERNHYYYADAEGKKKYTGVSTVLNSVYAKPWLLKWAANMAVEYIKENRIPFETDKITNLVCTTDELLELAKSAYTKKAQVAADFGTDAHAEAEKVIKNAIENKGGKVDALDLAHDSPQVRNFVKWAIEKDAVFLESEKRMANKELFLAGTCDFVCIIGGQTMLGDFKTSNSFSPSYHLQTAAYALMYKQPIIATVVVRCGKGGGKWNKEKRKFEEILPEDDFEVEYRYNIEEDEVAFRNALSLYRWRANTNEEI